MMQDKKGSDPAYQVSGAWCLTPVPIPTFQILTLRSAPLRFEMWEWCRGAGYQVSGIRTIFILHHASCILHPYLNKAVALLSLRYPMQNNGCPYPFILHPAILHPASCILHL